jgi:hypothetical protein
MTVALHLWNGLALYLPATVPAIPLGYDLTATFTEAPFTYVDNSVKKVTVYLTVVGVTYFLSGQVACGLWLMFLIVNVGLKLTWGVSGGDPEYASRYDQHFGAVLALFAAIVWVGRRHWATVLAQAVRGRRDGEPGGRYLSYPVAAWGFALCLAVMVGWLVIAGCTLVAAAVTVAMLMVLMIVITRIVAETGLPYSGLQVALTRPWSMLATAEVPQPVPVKSFYLASMVDAHHYDMREVAPVYMTHAAKVADLTATPEPERPRPGSPAARSARRAALAFLAAMMLALVVGYGVSAASMLWTEYTYASTLDQSHTTPINEWGAIAEPRMMIVDPVTRYAAPVPLRAQRSSALHLAIGFTITAVLSAARLRYEWWPLHPIGFVLLAPPALSRVWFSIFVGWLLKTLIVRLGGAALYTRARPVFLGIIVGESVAAGLWLVVALVCGLNGRPYAAYLISPR